jgi:CheY-like chemotaxis protein
VGNFELECVVKDTGIGIREEDRARLFDAYTRMDQKQHKYVEGTGLGLPITKRLVALMGGTITVESHYGKGSTFTVRFPQIVTNPAPIGKAVASELERFQVVSGRIAGTLEGPRVQMPGAKILVVDDVSTNLDVAVGMLELYGVTPDIAKNGPDAIQKAEETRYDLIFMDHMMPGMDGIEATKRLRASGNKAPIIALTANAIVGMEGIFKDNGFDGFLPKPIEAKKLDQCLKKWIPRNLIRPDVPNAPDVPENPFINKIKVLTTIDTAAGIRQFGGKADSFVRCLKSYAENVPDLLETMRKSEPGDAYITAVHGLKGSSRSVQAKELGDRAEKLEHAGRASNWDLVNAQNASLIADTEALIAKIREALGMEEPKEETDIKETLAPELKNRILRDLEGYNIKDLEDALKKWGNPEAERLFENFDYEGIKTIVETK